MCIFIKFFMQFHKIYSLKKDKIVISFYFNNVKHKNSKFIDLLFFSIYIFIQNFTRISFLNFYFYLYLMIFK